jgi:hypothetical protein
MIATVQLVPEVEAGTASRPLVEQLLMETAVALEDIEWKDSVPIGRSFAWLFGAVFLLIGGTAWALSQPAISEVLVARYFLSGQGPILQTQLEVTSGDSKLARGSNVRLAAVTHGEVPQEAVFQLMDMEGGLEAFTVSASEETLGEFELVVENAQAGFNYRVLAGDARSREYEVEVLDPPSLRELNFEVKPPAYTGIETYTTAASAFRMIEGATVSIRGQASEGLESAAVYFYRREQTKGGFDVGESLALQLASDGRALSAEVGGLSTEAGYISVRLLGRNGVESVNNTRYPIQWVMDSAPIIRIDQSPANQSTIAVGRSAVVSGSVLEDYRLESFNFCYEVLNDADEETPIHTDRISFEANGADMRFDFRFVAGVAREADRIEIQAPAGSFVRWWIEAVDNYALTGGPHVAETSKSNFKVVTAEEKIVELMGSVQESLTVIEETSERQVEAGKKLKQYIQQEKGTQ